MRRSSAATGQRSIMRSIIPVVILVFAVAASPNESLAQDVQVLKGGIVIDVESGTTRTADVVIRGNRIDTIGATRTPRGATVIDVTGKYILPGLWDKHLHYKDWFGEMLITSGVTSAFVQSGGGQTWLHAQNDGVHKGKILGPRMYFRERSFDVFPSVDAAREAVRTTIRDRKPSFIKAYTGLTPEQLVAVVEEADKAGLHVEGHLGISAIDAINAGIDGLTHSSGIALSVLKPEDLAKIPDMRVIDLGRRRVQWPEIETWDESETGSPNPDLTEYWLFLEDPRRLMMFGLMDRGLAQDLIDLMIREDVFIESCLVYVFRHVHDRMDEYRVKDHLLLNEPDLAYIPERIRVNVLDYTLLDKVTDEELALMEQGYRNFQWFTKTFADAGGKLLIGPDTTSLNHATMLPGINTHREMQLLVDTGLTPLQAIKAATVWPAQTLGKYADLGSVDEGKLADLLVLPRNPLEDITAFEDVELVMQDGRIQPLGYHYYHSNPIPWPPGGIIGYDGFGPVSEIPAILDKLEPEIVSEGGGDLVMTVTGGPFLSTSTVRFGDLLLKTDLVSASELRAHVPARLLQNVGSYPVTIVHRPPGTGETNTRYFIVKFR